MLALSRLFVVRATVRATVRAMIRVTVKAPIIVPIIAGIIAGIIAVIIVVVIAIIAAEMEFTKHDTIVETVDCLRNREAAKDKPSSNTNIQALFVC